MGRVVSFEISSQCPEKASLFYINVFGWEISEKNWEYYPVKTNKNDVGIDGGISKGSADYPHGTRIIIEVDSIDECLDISKSCGAQVIREKMNFDHFYLAYVVDPVGICFGLIQNKKR